METKQSNPRINMKKCCYEVLGVKKTATQEEIEISYKRLAANIHPDKAASIVKKEFPDIPQEEFEEKFNEKYEELNELFKQLSHAYIILSDPQKRKQYNLYGFSDNSSKASVEDQAKAEFIALLSKTISEISEPEYEDVIANMRDSTDDALCNIDTMKGRTIQGCKKITKIRKRMSGPGDGGHIGFFRQKIQEAKVSIKDLHYKKQVIKCLQGMLDDYSYNSEERENIWECDDNDYKVTIDTFNSWR